MRRYFPQQIAPHQACPQIRGNMAERNLPRVALLWTQFAAYHVDRCQAVAQRLAGRAEVWAVELATRSSTYAWDPSGGIEGARKFTLFPGEDYETVSVWRRLRAQFSLLRRCQTVLIGIGYNQADIIILSWLLRLLGVRVVVMSESKFDDFPRRCGFELFKSVLLWSYCGAIVGAQRQHSYMRFLGFHRRPVLPGYDTVGLDRIRGQGGGVLAPSGKPFKQRDFMFVGRFVAKKNLFMLVEAFATYCAAAGENGRRLVLVGSGPGEAELRARITALGIEHRVDLPGFLDAQAVSLALSGALALVLVSTEEQWGLVVNEALAFGLPVIASTAVGSRDVLVDNLINGFIVEPGSIDGIARAMLDISANEQLWRRMVAASHDKAWMGDTERLADAVEWLLDPAIGSASSRLDEFARAMGLETRK